MAAFLALVVAACGGGGGGPTPTNILIEQTAQTPGQAVLTADPPVAGATPFISFVTLHGSAIAKLATVNFTIAAAPGSVSRPVSATYSLAYLIRRAYAAAGSTDVTIPLFGLYAGTANAVTLDLTFSDATTYAMPLTVTTAAYVDPNQVYDRPTIVQARAAGSTLGFDFFYLKSNYGSPVVVDTDGRTRWVGPYVTNTLSSTFTNDGFVMGSNIATDIFRLELDGSFTHTGALGGGVLDFYHDIEDGKTALLDNVDATIGGNHEIESTAQEFEQDGTVLATWDLASIISAAMTAGGDDPTQFVRPGVDWFHMNTAIYDPSDDSVIISSRENFVIKLDYATGAIRWIFGDPTKYWHTFASLRALALTFEGPGLVPIGQHSVTIAPDGSLMLFNDGTASTNQPAGAPSGQSRSYSAVSDYVVDEASRTVTQAWSFDDGQALYSAYCSSARQVGDGSVLVDYAGTAAGTTRILGLDATHAVSFDIQYPNSGCNTAWNAQPIAFEHLVFQ